MKGYQLAVPPHQDGKFSSDRDGGDVLSATGAHALEEGQSDGIFGRDKIAKSVRLEADTSWRRLREHPTSVSYDPVARACRVSGVAQ